MFQAYVDIRPSGLPRSARPTDPLGRGAPSVPSHVLWVQQAWQACHGVFRDHPGVFAVALPGYQAGERRHLGPVVRVFAPTKESAGTLVAALSARTDTAGDLVLQIRDVPARWTGRWVAFHRVRAPRRNHLQPAKRLARLAELATYPEVLLRSHSTSNRFPVVIRREDLQPDRCGSPTEFGRPDSYGLGTVAHPVPVPDLPL